MSPPSNERPRGDAPAPSGGEPGKALPFALQSLCVLLASTALLGFTSAVTGPTFEELGRLTAVKQAEALVLGVSQAGLGGLRGELSSRVYTSLEPYGVFPALLSAWARLALGPFELIDPLTLSRSAWLGVAALSPLAVFWIAERSRGVRVGVLAAALLLVVPRWLHGGAVGSEAAALCGAWLLVVACYVRSLGGRRPICWSVASALALGVGLAVNLATLWIAIPLLVHFAFQRRRTLRRTLARGTMPVPAAVLFAVPVAPLSFLGVSPHLWGGKPKGIVRSLLAPLAREGAPVFYRGDVVTSSLEAPLYSISWTAAVLPFGVAALALVGAFVVARRSAVASAQRSPYGFGALSVVLLGFFLLFLPQLSVFPPRAIALLPVVCLFAAVGLERVANQTAGNRAPFFCAALVAVIGAVNLRDLSTASAHFGVLSGGTERAVEQRLIDAGDGSELAPIARYVDDLGITSARVHGQEVPSGYWEALSKMGRARTNLRASGDEAAADFVVVRGHADGAVSTVTRDGAVLWSLIRRG